MKRAKDSESDSGDFFSFEDLPEEWKIKKLGDIVTPSKEKIEPTKNSMLPYIGLEHIESNTSRIIGQGIARDAKSTKTIFHSGDVLYGKLRPYLNKVTIPEFEGVCSTDILVFNKNNNIDSRYLMRYLSMRDVVEYANLKSKGISLPRVSFESLAEIPIPTPPLPEQQRIVSRVEALLMNINAARERLQRVPLIMKKFRQAVLAVACEGRLTEGGRGTRFSCNTRDDTIEKILEEIQKANSQNKKHLNRELTKWETLESLELPEIPEIWHWVAVKDLTLLIQYGISVKGEPDEKNGIPILRMGNIQEGLIDLADLKFIPSNTDSISNFIIEPGDILFNRTNSPELVGKSAVFHEKIRAVFASYLVRVRPNSSLILSDYLCWWINSMWGREWAHTVRTDGVSQSNINAQKLSVMPIPLPPLAEQHELVRRVEALFARADAVEREVAAATKRADALTQAILAKAFRGELTRNL